jgi:hypothetical protein
MADNLNITSGSGVVIKTDDIGGVHYQQIKLVDGNLDSTSPTGVKDNPLIVSMQNTGATVTVSGGVTLLSSSQVTVNGSITALVTGGVTLLSSVPISVNVLNSSALVTVSGGVTLLSSSQVTVSGAVTALVTGGVTLLSSVPLTITGTTLISGGVTLLSSSVITAKRDVIAYTGTWIYAALSSANQTVVWAPAANMRFNITDIVINSLTATRVTLTQDSAATVTIMKLELAANGGMTTNLQTPYKSTQTNHALVVTSNAAGTNSYISVSGYESA